MTSSRASLLCGCVLVLVGCESEPECSAEQVGSTTVCEGEGLVCAASEGDQYVCVAPVVVRGLVFDARTDVGVAGASVVALDANGAARSSVVFTALDGTYELPIVATRVADGAPIDEAITLRVDAQGYQTFPTAPRTALPIELGSATSSGEDAPYVVMNVATDVALLPLPAGSGEGRIEGTVEHVDPGGTLVVAEVGGVAVSTAIADKDGAFVLFNVPSGDVLVDGYRRGIDVQEQTVAVAAAPVLGVVLAASSEGLSTVSGSVQIVNPGDCRDTSVILVVESTFQENVARGAAPAGLRAGGVTGAFEIPEVPPGRYVVLAAFENDQCVRDPDPCIGGTDIVHIEVPAQTVLSESFKVTGSLDVVSPGASALEIVTTAEPTFTWIDDSSEDGYELRVYDAFGAMVHEDLGVPGVSGGDDVTYTWTGASLEPGMIYQFRAWSWRRAERCLISSTEDLRGVFAYEP